MSPEIIFMQAVKGLGLDKARFLLSLAEAYDGSSIQEAPPVLSDKETKFLTAVGEKFSSLIPKNRQGRKPDPNSAFQQVSKALHSFLSTHKEANAHLVWDALVKATGLPLATCKANAYQVKGIKRANGYWMLAPIG